MCSQIWSLVNRMVQCCQLRSDMNKYGQLLAIQIHNSSMIIFNVKTCTLRGLIKNHIKHWKTEVELTRQVMG